MTRAHAQLPKGDENSDDVQQAKFRMISAVISQRQLLSHVHSTLTSTRTNQSTSPSLPSISVLESDIANWQQASPRDTEQTEQAIHLLKTQLQSLVLRPSILAPEINAENTNNLRNSTARSLAILVLADRQDGTNSKNTVARDLHSKIWRLQFCIAHLYALIERARVKIDFNHNRLVGEIDGCREVIEACNIDTTETQHLELAFEKLAKYITRRHANGPQGIDVIDEDEPRQVILGLYSPPSNVGPKVADARAYDPERVKRIQAEAGANKGSWNQMF